MIEIGEPALLTENIDRLAPGSVADACREASFDRVAVALSATHHPVDRLDRKDDPCEHNPANNPKLAHWTHKIGIHKIGAHRVLAGSKQFDETSMP